MEFEGESTRFSNQVKYSKVRFCIIVLIMVKCFISYMSLTNYNYSLAAELWMYHNMFDMVAT